MPSCPYRILSILPRQARRSFRAIPASLKVPLDLVPGATLMLCEALVPVAIGRIIVRKLISAPVVGLFAILLTPIFVIVLICHGGASERSTLPLRSNLGSCGLGG